MGDPGVDQGCNDTSVHNASWLCQVLSVLDPRPRPSWGYVEDFKAHQLEEWKVLRVREDSLTAVSVGVAHGR